MDQLVYYPGSIDPSAVQRALPAVTVITVYDRQRLVEALVGNPHLIGAIIEIDAMTDQWDHFLSSARRSFPLLPMLVLTRVNACHDEVACVDTNATAEAVRTNIEEFFAVPRQRERREHHRFDWPLRASLVGNDEVHRIRELSAGGAFLEPAAHIPPPGSACDIRIWFQNFTMTTRCEILDPRHVSSRAAPGFGVRFTSLSPEASEFIDRIVGDALASMLLDPSAHPEVPSIDEQEEVLAVGDEFSLTL
ncbi:MAG: PilZ domain-containing protein [Spirochaetota bacterium]